jgi:hypothetical protein
MYSLSTINLSINQLLPESSPIHVDKGGSCIIHAMEGECTHGPKTRVFTLSLRRIVYQVYEAGHVSH